MSIGDKLRNIRKNKGLTLKDVGEATGLSYSGLAEIERGERSCNSETLKLLAEFYGISSDYLLFDEPTASQQLSSQRLALYNGTKDLTNDQLNEILNFVDYVKNKK